MELPMLGEHCSESNCRRLDFLPIKCDCCKRLFCTDHYTYTKHNCPEAFHKNVQVPICPICNQLVTGKSDEPPDKRINRHIDTDCLSDKTVTKRKKVYSNRCSIKRCRQREILPFTCNKCTLNYCIRHRLPEDHDCKPVEVEVVVNGAGAESSSGPNSEAISQSTPAKIRKIQGNFSEDAALAQNTNL